MILVVILVWFTFCLIAHIFYNFVHVIIVLEVDKILLFHTNNELMIYFHTRGMFECNIHTKEKKKKKKVGKMPTFTSKFNDSISYLSIVDLKKFFKLALSDLRKNFER